MKRELMMAAFLCALAVAGCGKSSTLVVDQPALSSAERRMTLHSQAAWYFGDGRAGAMLVELPLPGAIAGRQFSLYLRMNDKTGEQSIGGPVAGGGFVGGFFVQLHGRRHGLTEVVSGKVTVGPEGAGKGDDRVIDVSVRCGDGAVIEGRVAAKFDKRKIEGYEKKSVDARNFLRGSGNGAQQKKEP